MQSSEEGSIKGRNETNTNTQNKQVERQQHSKKSEEKEAEPQATYYKIPSVRRQEEQDSKQYK